MSVKQIVKAAETKLTASVKKQHFGQYELIQSDIGEIIVNGKLVLRASGRMGSNGETVAITFKLNGKRISRDALFSQLV